MLTWVWDKMHIGVSPTNLSSLKLWLDMAKYYVEVIFTNRRPNCAIGIRNSSYFRSNGRQDTFTFRIMVLQLRQREVAAILMKAYWIVVKTHWMDKYWKAYLFIMRLRQIFLSWRIFLFWESVSENLEILFILRL